MIAAMLHRSSLTPAQVPQAIALPQRILFFSFDVRSKMGGIQRFDQRVIRCLADFQRSGRTAVKVISLRDADQVPADEVAALEVCGSRSSKLRAAIRFAKAVRSFKPDLILFGHVLLTPFAAISKRIVPGAKNVLFTHGIEVWDDPAFARVSKLSRWGTRKYMDRILPVSKFTADRMRKVFDLPETRFRQFQNAVDVTPTTDVSRTGRDAGSSTGPINKLLTVARLDEWGKGVGAVIEALPQIIQRLGQVEYTIVGDGKLRPDMEQLAQKHGVAANIRFAGRVSDEELDRLYAQSDAFVMPSLKEGFGIVYLEAWKHGLAVLAGNRDAGQEVVEDGVDGVVVDPTSTPAIVEGVVKLLADPQAAHRMGEAGRQKLYREYSHERFRQKFETALGEMAGANDAKARHPGTEG